MLQGVTIREWRREGYKVSTENALLNPTAVNEVLGSDLTPWATALRRDQLTKMLMNSLCFGLYAMQETGTGMFARAARYMLAGTLYSCALAPLTPS